MKGIGKLRRIFANHWEEYKLSEYKEKITKNIETNIKKVLACRTLLLGEHIYECPKCKKQRRVPHSCKSRFCSVCGYIAIENWITRRLPFLLKCEYHHVVATIPATFRWMIKTNKTQALNMFAKTVSDTILQWSKKRGFTPGIVIFFHSFGSSLKFHPHFHALVTGGGINDKGQWVAINSLPGAALMEIFRAKFIANIKKLFKDGILKTKKKLRAIYAIINKTYKKHWQFYTQRVSYNSMHTIAYCIRYAKKMIISEKRIINYNGKTVTITSKVPDKNDKSKKTQVFYEFKVLDFIRFVIQHIPDKYFRLIRYSGIYANRSGKKYAQARKIKQPLKSPRQIQKWRLRQHVRTGVDPLFCKTCQCAFVLKEIIPPLKSFATMSMKIIKLALQLPVQTTIWDTS